MTCTRRRESPVAIVLGANGFELRQVWRHVRFSVVFPGGPPPISRAPEGDLVVENAVFGEEPPDHDCSFAVTLLSDDTPPAEVYS